MRQPLPYRQPRQRLLALAVAGVLLAGVALAESGTVLKPTEMRSEPLGSAEVVAQLAAKQSVEITDRKGAWAGVKTDAGAEGWARILNIRTGTGEKSAASGNTLASVFHTGSSDSGASTGVKGLDAKILMGASPNELEAAKLDEFATTAEDARSFAQQAPLASQTVAYIEVKKSGRRQR